MRTSFAVLALLGAFAGCASMNNAMTPSAKLVKDDFDGKVMVVQEPVSAASSALKEAWHTLGFEWKQAAPDKIFITVGVNGVDNISAVEFNADGQFLKGFQATSPITNYGQWSTRRFEMGIKDFLTVAQANDVKMKVVEIDKYSVSSFGKTKPLAIVTGKFDPFLELLKQNGVEIAASTANHAHEPTAAQRK